MLLRTPGFVFGQKASAPVISADSLENDKKDTLQVPGVVTNINLEDLKSDDEYLQDDFLEDEGKDENIEDILDLNMLMRTKSKSPVEILSKLRSKGENLRNTEMKVKQIIDQETISHVDLGNIITI